MGPEILELIDFQIARETTNAQILIPTTYTFLLMMRESNVDVLLLQKVSNAMNLQ
jgi:hypothetical protein